MIGTYLLIMIVGYTATTLEFNSRAACEEVKLQIIKDVDSDKFAAQCFMKIGGKNKDA